MVLLTAQFITLFNQTALEVRPCSPNPDTILETVYFCSRPTPLVPDVPPDPDVLFLSLPQTMVTPLTQRCFSFGELGNSLMYGLCGVEVILGFFFVRWLSGQVSDRAVQAAGLVICSTACVWCLIFLADPQGEAGLVTLPPHSAAVGGGGGTEVWSHTDTDTRTFAFNVH